MRPEIDRIPHLERWLADPGRPSDVVFQGLDLSPYAARFCELSLEHCIFVGCRFTPELAAHIGREQAVMIPELAGKSFNVFRTQLYSPEELFAGFDDHHPESYAGTPDATIYRSYMAAPGKPRECGLDEILARRLHDFSITDALEELLHDVQPRGVIAIMGGHDAPRGDVAYRAIASLTHRLTRDGYLALSGGGPGIMEAANLGAFFANEDLAVLSAAIDELAKAPLFKPIGLWLAQAWRVRRGVEKPGRSLGVPTWFYGHEPPNGFATDIAKYFENSVREEGLLAIAKDGVVFAEGNAGTVQEIFQDACQNYYQTYFERASPMVLFGREYWTRRKEVHPLLMTLAREKKFEHMVLLSDDVDEIAVFLQDVATPRLPRP
jgi:predicted Rossmann-fold nucleotide-binding protein